MLYAKPFCCLTYNSEDTGSVTFTQQPWTEKELADVISIACLSRRLRDITSNRTFSTYINGKASTQSTHPSIRPSLDICRKRENDELMQVSMPIIQKEKFESSEIGGLQVSSKSENRTGHLRTQCPPKPIATSAMLLVARPIMKKRDEEGRVRNGSQKSPPAEKSARERGAIPTAP
jgi:hypothetical protein